MIGAGINLTMRVSTTNVINQDWINLQEAGVIIDSWAELTAELLSELRLNVVKFENEGLSAFISRWREMDNYYLDRPVKLIIGNQEIFGIARGIDQQGALLLEQDGNVKPYIGGDISSRYLIIRIKRAVITTRY